MPLTKVLPGGQITFPKVICEAIRLEPGNTVQIRVTGPDTFQITAFPRRRLNEWIERYRVNEPVDYDLVVAEAEADAVAEVIGPMGRERRRLGATVQDPLPAERDTTG